MKQYRCVWIISLVLAGAGWAAQAQEPPAPPKVRLPEQGDTFFMTVAPDAAATANTFHFITAGPALVGKTVKGAPYSATAVTETIQTLADGNRITHTTAQLVARDSEGRTRREQSLPAIGPWASGTPAAKLVTISDPVAGTVYVLDDRAKTVRKMPGFGGGAATTLSYQKQGAATGPVAADSIANGHAVRVRTISPDGPQAEARHEVRTEDLGRKNDEGVIAEGSRTTVTIPAGEMGNERPIEIVDERWYSSELQTAVVTRHIDPRVGETTFRLTKLSRSEPPSSQFEVPADYKVMEEGGEPFRIQLDKK